MKPGINISVTILTKNSSRHIGEVIRSLGEFEEVIVLDNGSTDNTLEIVESFSNVKVYHEKFIGFGLLKNTAVKMAGHDWIFSLDSDEVPSEELVNELRGLDLRDSSRAFMINRKNYFYNQEIKHSGWNPDWLLRIFNKNTARFNDNYVHEAVVRSGRVRIIKLRGTISHYTADTIEDIVDKMNSYTSLYGKSGQVGAHSPFFAFVKGAAAFIKTYFIRLGILDGWRGLVIAVMAANGAFFKYIKSR